MHPRFKIERRQLLEHCTATKRQYSIEGWLFETEGPTGQRVKVVAWLRASLGIEADAAYRLWAGKVRG